MPDNHHGIHWRSQHPYKPFDFLHLHDLWFHLAGFFENWPGNGSVCEIELWAGTSREGIVTQCPFLNLLPSPLILCFLGLRCIGSFALNLHLELNSGFLSCFSCWGTSTAGTSLAFSCAIYGHFVPTFDAPH